MALSEHDEIILANIEIFVDKMIADGSLPPEARDQTIEQYKVKARIQETR